MCGGNNNNNSNDTRRTVITDEYTFESTDETTVKYVCPPKPCPPPPQPQQLICICAPPSTPKYEPPRYIPLKRCPSLTSVVTVNFPVCGTEAPKTPASLRRCASIKRVDNCCKEDNTVVTLVNLPLNPPRPSRSRACSRTRLNCCGNEENNKTVRSTSITYRSNENLNLNDLNIKYDFEAIECPPPPKPKECTCPPKVTVCTCPPKPCNPCPLPVYPSICAPKPQPAPPACTCPPKPKECTCPPKPSDCTCPPPPPPTKITICSCPPPQPKPCNPCPLPVYPSICNKTSSSSPCGGARLSGAKSYSNLSTIETTTRTTLPSYEEARAACAQQQLCSPPASAAATSQQQTNTNSLTYVYNDSDNDRQVTYIRHTDNDTGLSLPGCLVKCSETHLPVSRSVNLGPIFNGNSFGLLTESVQIRDKFDLSFEFRTNARNGIMAIIVDNLSNDSFFLELYDSQIKSTLFLNGEADSCWTDFSSNLLSNDIWINVNVTLNKNKMCLTVKNNFYTKQHRCQLEQPIRGDLFVAGHPSTIEPPFVCRSKSKFFVGEMRNFCVNNSGIKWYGAPSSKIVRLRNWY